MEMESLEQVDVILIDVDALGKLQLYSATAKPWVVQPPNQVKAMLSAGATRAIVAPEHLAAVLAEFGWTEQDVVVGKHLAVGLPTNVPDVGKGDEDEDSAD